MFEKWEIIDLPNFSDERGRLVPFELEQLFGYRSPRLYWIDEVPQGQLRGGHSHKTEQEAMIMVAGSATFVIVDQTGKEEEVTLSAEKPQVLLMPPGYWHEVVNFSEGAILVVASSTPYTPNDYVMKRPRR